MSIQEATQSTPTTQTHYRTCNICEALCGIEIIHKGENIISIKGDKNDPLSRGHICPKAVALQDFYFDEDRLRSPLKKTPGGFQEISWEEAFELTASKIKEIQNKYGHNAVAVFLGNPNAHNMGSALFMRPFLKALKTRSRFSASSVDQMPHHVAALHMLGHTLLNPVPDLDRTNYLLIMGANPLVSNGSMMSSPDISRRFRAIQERGGKIVVIDPRKTETAQKADEHVFIKPESDAVFLLAMIHVLFAENKIRLNHLEDAVTGLDEIKQIVQTYSPEKAESITGIQAEKIRSIGLEMAAADKAVLYSRMGLSTQTFGGLCLWLSNVFNILNGNYDREGGMMFPSPAIDPISFSPRKGRPDYPSIPLSRVRKLPKYLGEIPAVSLAEEIETEGEGQIKALVCIAGNPVLSVPNGKRVEKAFEKLDFMVCSDIYLTETSRHADIIFPATTGLEISQYDITFLNLAIRNIAKYSPPLFPKKGNIKHDWEILAELTARLKGEKNPGQTPEMFIDMALKMGRYAKEGITLAKLKAHPHGIDLGPLKPCLKDRLQTDDDTVRLAPQVFLDDLQRLDESFSSNHSNRDFPFQMIGRRVLRQHNTWTHNSYRLSKGKNECTLLMNPEDASQLGISSGESVLVTSRVGEIKVEIEVTDDI
ncbi:MAG: molybdopterin-dependent oxidoreductase, partial [Bacteroidetes bacterium]|nr:molybdopterin-dependent oxidoreductase [Bacteroidota bacterium]